MQFPLATKIQAGRLQFEADCLNFCDDQGRVQLTEGLFFRAAILFDRVAEL
jgi:hypothetical protein